MRTEEADKRFKGFWYCYTCGHYTCNLFGIMDDHTSHDVEKIGDEKDYGVN